MPLYRIATRAGTLIGAYEADDPQDALEAMIEDSARWTVSPAKPYALDPECEFEHHARGADMLIRIEDHDTYEAPSYDSPGQDWSAEWSVRDPLTGEESPELYAMLDGDDRMFIDESCEALLHEKYWSDE